MAEPSYMTRGGFETLKEELKRLKTIERPQCIKDIEVARAHGDLRENAEYEAAKNRQGFVEGRVKEIEHKLATAKVVDLDGQTPEKVIFGAVITVEDVESGDRKTYQIVGVDEADIAEGKVSYQSPIARAMFGRSEDDEVVVKAPGGDRRYTIISIGLP
ncbi:MAG: transcription elongation factor GreA [Candidatus Methylomirabilis sp.]|nr:transcription elongation factor GreA [Deltaproteobacteria bacterium]